MGTLPSKSSTTGSGPATADAVAPVSTVKSPVTRAAQPMAAIAPVRAERLRPELDGRDVVHVLRIVEAPLDYWG
jgi:hypothetical protein